MGRLLLLFAGLMVSGLMIAKPSNKEMNVYLCEFKYAGKTKVLKLFEGSDFLGVVSTEMGKEDEAWHFDKNQYLGYFGEQNLAISTHYDRLWSLIEDDIEFVGCIFQV